MTDFGTEGSMVMSGTKSGYRYPETFVYGDYHNHPPLSGFLPGIAGVRGVPLWAFYVNRGQGIASFGVESKDGSIVRFQSAVTAYRAVSEEGFRTFLRLNRSGRHGDQGNNAELYEPFQPEAAGVETEFVTTPWSLEVKETNPRLGITVRVDYCILPDEPVAGLIRRVSIENGGDGDLRLEVLDGLPIVAPSGVPHAALMNTPTTATAWMQAEKPRSNMGLFRARASVGDTTDVSAIRSAHFAGATSVEDGSPGRKTSKLELITDPDSVFPRGTRMLWPAKILARCDGQRNSVARVSSSDCGGTRSDDGTRIAETTVSGKFPCALFTGRFEVPEGSSVTLCEVFGHMTDDSLTGYVAERFTDSAYLSNARDRSREIVGEVSERAATRTSRPEFDAYCKQSFLDNALRGGVPHRLTTGSSAFTVSVFARKHGDLERDYNWFNLPPEPYSQGSGNFRDVCQNRRLDVVHELAVERATIHEFVSLIQADGYNPLVVEAQRFTLSRSAIRLGLDWLMELSSIDEEAERMLREPFTAGALYRVLRRARERLPASVDECFSEVLGKCRVSFRAEHGEGFWIDHWTYIVDLLDSYKAVYPEREYELYFGSRDYPYYDNAYTVVPRAAKWYVRAGRLRQWNAVVVDPEKTERIAARDADKHWVRDRRGHIYYATLFEKLLSLATVKFVSRDPLGIGLEMEADKPGWNDAMNGLPSICGSSLSEVWDLIQLVQRMDAALAVVPGDGRRIEMAEEVAELLRSSVELLGRRHEENSGEEAAPAGGTSGEAANRRVYEGFAGASAGNNGLADEEMLQKRWHAMSSLREQYRERTRLGFTGRRESLEPEYIRRSLELMEAELRAGAERGRNLNGGRYPTFLVSQPVDLSVVQAGLESGEVPEAARFHMRALPDFLEGAMKAVAGVGHQDAAREIHRRVTDGPLYDRALKMYRLNAPLDGEGVEIGRARSFTPGWLENASIWLHMEYKYLLALLRAGLYREFWSVARTVLIPFLSPTTYGRSNLENCSFIASSAHPDPDLHGRGFVARLSGSTAELLSIRWLCFAGPQPFRRGPKGLELQFNPVLPADFFDEDGSLEFRFLRDTMVVYRLSERRDLFPDAGMKPARIRLRPKTGNCEEISGGVIPKEWAEEVRNGEVARIEVYFTPS